MQPKRLLPSTQEPATASYPGLDKTNPKSHNRHLKIRFILYFTLCLLLPRGLLPQGYFIWTTIFTNSFSHACHLYFSFRLLWLDHPDPILQGLWVIKFVFTHFLYSPIASFLVGPNILLSKMSANPLIFIILLTLYRWKVSVLYIRTQSVPRSKHSPRRLYKISLLTLYEVKVIVYFEVRTQHIRAMWVPFRNLNIKFGGT